MSDKEHAKEYLEAYIKENTISGWLSDLINEIIATNGDISDNKKEVIYENLLKENKIKTTKTPDEEGDVALEDNDDLVPEIEKLTIDNITHLSGVNALTKNSTLNLSKDCTVVFGLNGTGKSGYFKIINEIAGADNTKEILPNIHEDKTDLNVEINYSLNNDSKSPYIWTDKDDRGVAPFDKIKVFDTEYLPFYLDERESVLNLEPLGLHLFRTIANIIDEFKDKIKNEKSILEDNKIDIQPLIDQISSEDIQNILLKNSPTEEDKEYLKGYYDFSEDEKNEIENIEKDKSELEKNSTDSQQKILNQDISEIDDLKTRLDNLKESLEKGTESAHIKITDYKLKKKLRDERIKEFEVLKKIPSKDSDEWNEFIESAERYGDVVSDKFDPEKKCVYCHQPLTPEALEKTKAYSKYLSDKSQSDLKEAEEKIIVEIENLEEIKTDFSPTERLKEEFTEVLDDNNVSCYELLKEIFSGANTQIKNIVDSLENKTKTDKEYSLDLVKILEKLNKVEKKKNGQLNKLCKSKEERDKEIAENDKRLGYLRDRKNITEWRTNIEKNFNNHYKCDLLTDLNSNINTSGITRLGSIAHDELLTESIATAFQDELIALGKKDIDVKLKKIRGDKGSLITKLMILENDVVDVLSEGEQKAVGVALFLAEIENSEDLSPVVFDDPVNSLDYKTSEKLAKRLIEMSENRQVVIFTHNKFFYDDLIYWANQAEDDHCQKTHHICKDYSSNQCNNTRGCHVLTYNVKKRSKKETGIITEKQQESCSYFLNLAQKEIDKDEYINSTVSDLIKSAIEYYIDKKILRNVGLNQNNVRGGNILWDQIKKIKVEEENVNKIHDFWKTLSSRGTHVSQASTEQPIETEEFQEMIDFLKKE